MKLMIFGLGYSGQAIARQWPGDVVGTTRNAERAEKINAEGMNALVFNDKPSDQLIQNLANVTHILVSAAPNENGDPILNALPDLLAHAPLLQWVGYLSTVGVYGDFDGAWIDEHTTPKPVSKRGQWRVAAEQNWVTQCQKAGGPLAIFRLAGIYGPNRSAFDKLNAGKSRRIVKKGQVFNRIHVDDIAQMVCAAGRQKAQGIFNGADDEPAPPQIVIEHAAKMLNVTPPPEEDFATASMTPMARSFYGDNKRCGNARLKKDLGVKLYYPTYREGLEHIFKVMT